MAKFPLILSCGKVDVGANRIAHHGPGGASGLAGAECGRGSEAGSRLPRSALHRALFFPECDPYFWIFSFGKLGAVLAYVSWPTPPGRDGWMVGTGGAARACGHGARRERAAFVAWAPRSFPGDDRMVGTVYRGNQHGESASIKMSPSPC